MTSPSCKLNYFCSRLRMTSTSHSALWKVIGLKSHSDPIFLSFVGVVVSTVASQQERCGFDNSVFTLYPNLRIKVDDFMALIKS